jgi:hypothetical protein
VDIRNILESRTSCHDLPWSPLIFLARKYKVPDAMDVSLVELPTGCRPPCKGNRTSNEISDASCASIRVQHRAPRSEPKESKKGRRVQADHEEKLN